MYDDGGDFGFDEFNDWDATSCAEGDYNAFEEEQVFQDECAERAARAEDERREEIRLAIDEWLTKNVPGRTLPTDAEEILRIVEDLI